jgi:hypothetical protein
MKLLNGAWSTEELRIGAMVGVRYDSVRAESRKGTDFGSHLSSMVGV